MTRDEVIIREEISPTLINVINVYGEEAEPVCDYLRCHHKFSEHGLKIHKCQCKYPRNSDVGSFEGGMQVH
jgi:hypothetical protein